MKLAVLLNYIQDLFLADHIDYHFAKNFTAHVEHIDHVEREEHVKHFQHIEQIEWLEQPQLEQLAQLEIKQFCLDSRQVTSGTAYIAVSGTRTDGKKYIPEAIQRGAALILAEKSALTAGLLVNDQSIAITPENVNFGIAISAATKQSKASNNHGLLGCCISRNDEVRSLKGNALILYIADLRKKLGKIVSFFYGQPSRQLAVFGVTGTNGKTSTCFYLAQLLAKFAKPCAVIGTIGIGLPDQLAAASLTTPDTITLQRSLADFLQQGINHVAMEVSSHGLSQYRVAGIEFNTVVFTNLSHEHADYHPTMQDYWQAKLRLFTEYNYRHAVINFDDPYGRELLAYLARDIEISRDLKTTGNIKITGYSLDSSAIESSLNEIKFTGDLLVLRDIQYSLTGVSATLQQIRYGGALPGSALVATEIVAQTQLRLQLLGDGNLYNVLAAIAVCLGDGFALADILLQVSSLSAPIGRMQIVSTKLKNELSNTSKPSVAPENVNLTVSSRKTCSVYPGSNSKMTQFSDHQLDSPLVVVDFAHTPAALGQALMALRRHCQGKLFCVFGCGGDRDRSKRPLMLQEALKYADQIVITQDNSRTEDPQQIVADIVAGLEPQPDLVVNLDRSAAIHYAIQSALGNDIVLIAGKGHEQYQILADGITPFSDMAVAEQALAKRNSYINYEEVRCK